jgi:hypothetical protein
MTRLRTALAAAALAAAAACATMAGAPSQQAALGQDFQLARGATAAVDRLTVRFTAVIEDSRCPLGVQCIRAGEAKVHLELHTGNQADDVVLSTDGRQQRYASLGAYDVRLVALNPPRRTDVAHPRYVATLRVSRH